MRIIKNKKGIEFLPLLMVFLIPVLLYLSYVLLEQLNDTVNPVGRMSKKLFDTYDEAYKKDLFIENAAKQSLNDNLFRFASTGGNPHFNCGEYMGYALITNENDICYEYIEGRFIEEVESQIMEELSLIDYDIDYDIKITEKNSIVLRGDSEDINFPIYMDNKPILTLNSQQPATPIQAADGTLNGP